MTERNLPDLTSATGSDGIVARLDTIISLLIPPHRAPNGDKTLRHLILELCDYEHTTEDIIKATKKSANHVQKELSLLRSKGLVKTVHRGGSQVHVRLPAKT
jgi:hypothetical protein